MNLYVIKFEHHSQKDSKLGIVTYVVAENEEKVYEFIKSEPVDLDWSIYTSWKYDEKEGIEYDGESFKEYIIRVGGEMYSEYANYDDLYYGKTYYGWELIKENIQDYQIDALCETIGLVNLDGYFK